MKHLIERGKQILGIDFWSQQANIKARYSEYKYEKRSMAAKKGWNTRRANK